jgi:hypothetical protein
VWDLTPSCASHVALFSPRARGADARIAGSGAKGRLMSILNHAKLARTIYTPTKWSCSYDR